jgi:nitric oxide reductase activation protein
MLEGLSKLTGAETADSKEASYGEGDADAKGRGSSCGDEELDRKIASDASEMLEGLSKLTGAETADSKEAKTLSDDDMATMVKDKGGLLGEICEGLVELGSGTDTYFTPAPSDASRYEKSHQRVRRYVPAISKIIRGHCREYKLIHRSMRSGVLDTNKLAEAIQGVSTVYIREGEVKSDRVAVCVLIDESGSMSGERIEAARDTAVLLNEAVGSIPQVELFIYGHTGDIRTSRSTELHVYREKGYSPKYALGSVRACCENRDGIAIYEVAQRVRKQTQLPVLFFILSDGAPCAGSYHGESAMNHVREMVNKVEAMQFNVVQVCINHSYPPERMFKHFVILEDLSTLAISLGRVIKKATMKNTASRVI